MFLDIEARVARTLLGCQDQRGSEGSGSQGLAQERISKNKSHNSQISNHLKISRSFEGFDCWFSRIQRGQRYIIYIYIFRLANERVDRRPVETGSDRFIRKDC